MLLMAPRAEMDRSKPVCRLACMTAMGLAVAACTTPGNIADQALDANRAVETSHNRILLLNILRAAEGKPLYFTALDQLFGPLGNGQVTANLNLPFDAAAGRSLGLSLTPQQPNYNISVQNGRAFTRGFLSPVSPGIFGYYLRQQRWAAGTVLKLFVADVMVVDSQGVARRRFVNDPGDQASLAEFQGLVDALAACDLRARVDTEKRAYGPPVGLGELASIKNSQEGPVYFEPLEAADSASSRSHQYRPYVLFSRTVLDIVLKPGQAHCAGIPDDVGGHLNQAGFLYGRESDKDARDLLYMVPDQPKKDSGKIRDALITLRSPEAMIDYLGHLSRQALLPLRRDGESSVPLDAAGRIFELQRLGAGAGQAAPEDSIWLTYLGHTYYVLAGSSSMQVLSLISQVIGLQKESSTLPGIGTFRVLP